MTGHSDEIPGAGRHREPACLRANGTAATCAGDALVRATRWLDLGHDDARLPAACVVEFSAAGFDGSAFARHGVARPASLRDAVARRQAEFLAGRLAARHAIECLGHPPSVPAIGPMRAPLWPTGIVGSITHVDGLAAAVALPAPAVNGVGIDIERIIPGEAGDAVRQLALCTAEQVLLDRQGEPLSPGMRLAIAFSAKESFFKGVSARVGRYFDFDAVRLTAFDPRSGRLLLTLQESLHPALPAGRAFGACFRTLDGGTVATSFVW